MIRTKQKKYYASDLQNIVVRNSESGSVVYLKDIASLKETWVETPSASYIDGERAISLKIVNNEYEDVEKTSAVAKEFIEKYNSQNSQTRLLLLYDNSEEISSMKKILTSNGIIGFGLVVLFLSLFLNRYLSFWVALGIPISLFGMFIIAALSGVSFNMVSLFGMIVVLGVLVDDAVVIAESIYVHHTKGKGAIQAAMDGTKEVLPAVYSGVITTIIAFAIFFFLEGIMGQFFIEMAVVIISALAFSLFEGTFILPGHIAESKALSKDYKPNKFEKFFSELFGKVKDEYFYPLLKKCLNNKTLTVSIFAAFLIITLGAMNAGIIRQGDVSSSDHNSFSVNIEMPPGTPPEVTLKYLKKIETAAVKVGKEYDKKRTDTLKTIRYIVTNITSENKGNIRGILQTAEHRDYRSQDFVADVKASVGSIPEAQKVNYVQSNHWGKPVSVQLISRDIAALEKASEELKTELEKIEDLKNVINNKKTGVREIEITLKPRALSLGLTLQEVMNFIRSGFYGNEAMRFSRGKEDVRIMVRYPKTERAGVDDLENMRIRLAGGQEYPLKEIANFNYKRNLVEIVHYGGKRSILVEADVKDSEVNLSFLKRDINEKILPAIKAKYPGISFANSGQEEDQGITMQSIVKTGPIFIILLLIVIMFTFKSKLQTALVFCLIPFSFIGVAWGHVIHNKAIGMVSYLGMIALLGVMVNNAIILIDTFNSNLKKGMNVKEAVLSAAQSRFRPIVLTSLTTISGLFPLIFSNSTTAEIVVPMAITMAYGLLIATLLSLVLLPVVIMISNKMRYYFSWAIHFEKPENFEAVEPAIKELKYNLKS